MTTLPTLPGCGQPATTRLEVCSPPTEAAPYGTLAAITYACPDCAPRQVRAVKDAGLLSDPLKLLPGRVCGDLVDFTGGDR